MWGNIPTVALVGLLWTDWRQLTCSETTAVCNAA